MSTLQIIGAPQSNFVWVTRIVATEKGIPYELVSAMPHTALVGACHPLGKIPAMRHGEVTLGESRAICLYIDRAFAGPSLVPADVPHAAKVEQWVSIVCTHVDLLLVRQYVGAYFFPGTPDGSPDRNRIDPIMDSIRAQIAFLDDAVRTTGHLAGTTFTLADAYLVPILFYLRDLPESGAMLQQSRHLLAYLDRHLQRPSVKATIPPPMSSLELQATG
jgi:glutathione S-transferase